MMSQWCSLKSTLNPKPVPNMTKSEDFIKSNQIVLIANLMLIIVFCGGNMIDFEIICDVGRIQSNPSYSFTFALICNVH